MEKYGYACFIETYEQVNRQYNAMPEAFKGHFTTDEVGEIISLRKPKKVKKMMDNFWEDNRKNTSNNTFANKGFESL